MAELNLKQIIDRLNAEFMGDTRKLVFWYDDKAEFAEDIESVELENANFYKKHVRSAKERTVVIISDAMRYEVGQELFKRMMDDPKCSAKLDVQLSVLPSYTRLGMASLLPHSTLTMTDDFRVLADDVLCDSLACRQTVLQNHAADSACVQFDDISVKTVQTTNGHAVVVTDKTERQAMKEKYGKRKDIKLIESQPVSKAYSIVSRDDAGKPVRRGYWKMQEHLSGDVTWQCSRCKTVFQYREAFCPKCHSENKKTNYDPAWVDEMEGIDAMLGD